MESFGINKKQGKFHTLVPATHTIDYSFPSPNLLEQVENLDVKSSLVSDNYVIEANNYGSMETVQWYGRGKETSYAVCNIDESFTPTSLN